MGNTKIDNAEGPPKMITHVEKLPSTHEIINRLKVMCQLDPVAYPQGKQGQIELYIRGRAATSRASVIRSISNLKSQISNLHPPHFPPLARALLRPPRYTTSSHIGTAVARADAGAPGSAVALRRRNTQVLS